MRLGPSFSALLCTALAACETIAPYAPPASYYGYTGHAMYNARELGSVREHGPVPVIVRGSPFPGVAPDALARTIAPMIAGANGGAPLQYTADRSSTRVVDHVVVIAYGHVTGGPAALCANPDAALTPSAASPLHAEAAFCIGPTRVTEIQGDLRASPRAVDDPVFRDFTRGLMRNLMPPYNWNLGPCRPGDC